MLLPSAIGRADAEKLLVESVFTAMLELPASTHSQLYYTCVLTDISSARPSLVPTVRHAAFEIFKHLDTMDPQAVDVFASWFAHFLSNVEWAWDWVSWESSLSLSPSAPKMMWLADVLERMVRIFDTLPSAVVPACHVSHAPSTD